jgi:uncharacterized circularly permuted ATP-grasp superfamily protein/uncharacterized alpha-E superfamily protein
LLPEAEWRGIASAVAQRARLLDAVLGDLYGPQHLLAEGLVPPALVFGQRGYLWPAHGVVPPSKTWLHVYAADLARAPDGRWWVIADRTRGPSGAGYALSNRMTLARAFPDAFRELSVASIASFFASMQSMLHRLAPIAGGEAPLAVLLTPGPYNETYFEHAFLARWLGLPLVEGQDLLVRGDSVFLKTLSGLRRVHAILRRLDDDYCDPVELRADSALGIPGLLHAVRAGTVVLANALGSGVLETPALAGFLPGIARRLLGEELVFPSIATWWCGEAPALDYVTEHLDELVVKPTYSSIRMEPVFGHALDKPARAELIDRMRAQPHAYVAQEWVRLSRAPTWGRDLAGRLMPRAIGLRVFAVATADGGYTVMPGALARVAPRDGDVVSMQSGGSSKDVWIPGAPDHVESPVRWTRRVSVAEVTTVASDIPSRVGESLFWMGRYAERCEAIARLLRAGLVRIADASAESAPALGSIRAACAGLGVLPAEDASLIEAVRDPALPGGLAANVHRLHGAANHVRERLSTDNWHVFQRLPSRLPRDASVGAALVALDEVMLACVSLAGFAMDDMTRDEGWRFLVLGRRLERLAHLAAIVATVLKLRRSQRGDALEWLLEAANSIVTFRARYRRQPELMPVLHLVVLDETNPHSVVFQLRELDDEVGRVTTELGGERPGAPLSAVLATLREPWVAAFDTDDRLALEEACATLAVTLGRAREAAFALSDELARRFFSHAGSPASVGLR